MRKALLLTLLGFASALVALWLLPSGSEQEPLAAGAGAASAPLHRPTPDVAPIPATPVARTEAPLVAKEPVEPSYEHVAAVANHTAAPVDRLLAAGFTRARAEEILQAEKELRIAAATAELAATGSIQPLAGSPRYKASEHLRDRLGDGDYERYLVAMGRPTHVAVGSVEPDSPAANAGLRPGDTILTYDGRRVFDLRELNALMLQAPPGAVVPTTVERDGYSLELYVSGGPLGVGQAFSPPQ
jgi:membrane-associated protease RseP (regulator of RpoE activity)